MTIDDKINELVEYVMIEMEDILLDDDIPDFLDHNWDARAEAIDYLIEKLEKIKKG